MPKFSWMALKLWNLCKFSPSKVSRYIYSMKQGGRERAGEEAMSHWHYKNTQHLNNYKDCDLLDLQTFPSHTGVLQRTQCPSQSWLSCHPASYHWCILLHSQPTDENNILWLTIWVKEPAPLDIVEVSVILAVRIWWGNFMSQDSSKCTYYACEHMCMYVCSMCCILD